MIGIIGALDIEIKGLLALMTERRDRKICGITFSAGKIGGVDVVTAVCGVGKVFAAMCATVMCVKFKPALVVNTGVAGGVDNALGIGDILVSDSALQHDFDTTAFGDPRGWIQALETVNISADRQAVDIMLSSAKKAGLKAYRGIVASGDCFVAEGEQKKKLRDDFGASACEMEGGAIAAVAAVNMVPFVILRSISDGADGGAPTDFPAFCKLAAGNSVKVLTYALPELGRKFR